MEWSNEHFDIIDLQRWNLTIPPRRREMDIENHRNVIREDPGAF